MTTQQQQQALLDQYIPPKLETGMLSSFSKMRQQIQIPKTILERTRTHPNCELRIANCELVLSPAGMGLVACGLIIIIAKYFDSVGSKNQLATARWGGVRERNAARKIALKQLRRRKHNRVALYVGTPTGTTNQFVNDQIISLLPSDPQTIYIPDAQRGVMVIGGPGSGKSFSMLNPLIRSAIDQGLPLILYDFKYSEQESATADAKGQAPILAGYALERGYDVTVLAPGYGESCIANPLDFLRDEEDSEMARQLAMTINRNLKLGDQDNGNSFFTNAGDQLVQAILMLAKGTMYPDIMMCQAILGLPKLVERIMKADLNFLVREAFSQFVSVAGSPETAASIVGTASGLFSRFMVPNALAAFCGQSNIPLDLSGRQMIVFGMNKEKRDVIAPLLVSILHLIVSRNVGKKRSEPLILALDELPTLYLPALVDWLNQNREDGLVSILGLQNLSMLQDAYGEHTTNAIFGGCATKAFFNPNDDVSADKFSKYLGDEEIRYNQKSRSYGGKGGANTSVSQQKATRKLYDVNQFNTLKEGKAVLMNPGFSSRNQISLPLLHQFNIPKVEINSQTSAIKHWYEFQQYLRDLSGLTTPTSEEMRLRREEAERLLPMFDKQELVKTMDF